MTVPSVLTSEPSTATVIDASSLGDRVLQMLPGTQVVLENLTLVGGLATDDGTPGTGPSRGGGVLDDGGALVLNGVVLKGNKAEGGTGLAAQGGGLYSANGAVTIGTSCLARSSA